MLKKKIISFVVVIVLCLGLVAPGLAVMIQTEIIPKITITIPGSNAQFTLENVSAMFRLTTRVPWCSDEEIPEYRFTFPGADGRVRINQPADLEFALAWVENGQIGIAGGGGRGEATNAAGERFGGIPDDWSADAPGVQVIRVFINEDGTLTGAQWDAPVAKIVSFYFGFPFAHEDDSWGIIYNYPEDLISYELVEGDSEIFTMTHTDLYRFSIMELAVDNPETPDLTTASEWAREDLTRAIELGLVPQNLQSNYTQATTRAEFALLAVTLYENITDREIAIDRSIAFSDTTDTNVHKAATIGVVMGVGGNRFDPNAQLTREQAAVMLARLADAIGQPFPPSAPTFADNAQVSSWAADAVGQMQATGIMGGVGDNRFAPGGDYTREQSIVTILRLFDVLD